MFYFKMLSNVCGPNEYCVKDEIHIQKNNSQTLYFQLYTTNCEGGLIRYLPTGDISNTITMKFRGLDEADDFDRVATQAFVGDSSIYKIDIGPLDCFSFNGFFAEIVEVSMVSPPALTPTKTNTIFFQTATDLAVHLSGQKSYRV